MARFQRNKAGFTAFVLGPEMARAMLLKAEKGADWGRANSPVDTGEYAASWKTESIRSEFPSVRAAARIINDSGHAAAVEFGNRTNGGVPQRVVGKAGLEAQRADP